MKLKIIEEQIDLEYEDCFWSKISQSTSREGLQFREQNPQIDFCRCRNNCPLFSDETCCNFYLSLSKLNFVPILQ